MGEYGKVMDFQRIMDMGTRRTLHMHDEYRIWLWKYFPKTDVLRLRWGKILHRMSLTSSGLAAV